MVLLAEIKNRISKMNGDNRNAVSGVFQYFIFINILRTVSRKKDGCNVV